MIVENNYTAESVKTLDGITHIRLRPSMYIGSIEEAGLHQIWLEIISNSVDEYLNGGATRIEVELLKNGGIRVSDNGRGIPIGKHESGCSILEAVFGITNTGAKYDNEGKSGYNSSGGTNGIGAKATNALSTHFKAESFRGGLGEQVIFSRGEIQSHKTIKPPSHINHGVVVEFTPDPTVLNCTTFNWDKIYRQLEELSYLCKGLSFGLKKEGDPKEIVFHSENGLLDYISDLNKNNIAIGNPFYCNTEGLEIAMLFNTNSSYSYKLYTNNIPQYKGTHHTGFKTALTTVINQYAREKGLIKEKDDNLQGTDLEEGQILILSLRYLNPIYEGQNKENLTSAEARTYVQRIATQELKNWLNDNPKDAKNIIEKALVSKKAREAAKKARAAIKGKVEQKKQVLKMPSKLADAYGKDRKKCELFIVEGDSAGGGMKDARDNETQAILPVRGKILNVLKAPLEKAIANAEINDMMKAFGLTIDIKSKKVLFDEDDLKYGKIIIASDADVDGAHIQSLFYTFLWTFAPELIEQGYVYASVPPLYKITLAKGYKYLKDDEALDEFKKENAGKKFTVGRMKGLGEMDAAELAETMLNPSHRTLKQVTLMDRREAGSLFSRLMGDSPAARKEYIEKHSGKSEVIV